MCELCKEIVKREHVIKEYENFVLLFNRYPYLPGSVMIISKNHIENSISSLGESRYELADIMLECEAKIKNALNIDSINFGLNVGASSGASIPDHFHMHVVPRKPNDIGFFNIMTNSHPSLKFPEVWQHILNAFSK